MQRATLIALLAVCGFVLISCAQPRGPFTGINTLSPSELTDIDKLLASVLQDCRYLNVAIVRDNQVAFTRSYKRNRLDRTDVYASVSKPVTATMILQLLEEGVIKSLDDPVRQYVPRYADALPENFPDHVITIRQLLLHRSGIRHLSDMWQDKKLNLAFAPDADILYSTQGYAVLGEVIEALTGQRFSDAVATRIGTPIDAASFKADDHYIAPGAHVRSTVGDMARFGIGVMTNAYLSETTFQEFQCQPIGSNPAYQYCLGWFCSRTEAGDLMLFHSGSNGRPRAYLLIQPHSGRAVALTALMKSRRSPASLERVAHQLLMVLMETNSNK